MTTDNIIYQCKQISKTYHDGNNKITVLDKLDLAVSAAEHLAIIGSSGSGKSTLLHIMGTLDQPSSGDILFQQQSVLKFNEQQQAAFRNQNLGFIYQFHHLLAEFSALENVAMPRMIAKVPKQQALDEAEALLKKVGLSHRIDHRPAALSGGERQRVAIARALVNQPKIVFADEPTGNLDKHNAESVFELIDEIKQSFDTSFVFVTHDLELAKRMDRQLKLQDGKLVDVTEAAAQTDQVIGTSYA